ncbi:MAG: GTP cyclohydrolase I [Labilithrix sp.]|nr:GTP cyclohydrolase I [Labilithrix sp.]
MALDRNAAAGAIDAFLRAIGRDPAVEPELVGTGARVADAYIDELCAGYAVDTRALLAAGVLRHEGPAGLVVVRDVPVATTCPHHLLVATGTATIAMHARESIVGLGVLAALVDAHARRLTLQERIGESVVDDLERALAPEWVACRIVLVHGCMVARGERALGSRVETVAVRGPSASLSMIHAAVGVGS